MRLQEEDGTRSIKLAGVLVALGLLLLACGGDGPASAPAASPTPASPPTAAPSPTPTPDYSAVCRALASGRPCYSGPLFDAHLHLTASLPLPELPAYLDRDGLVSALVFYGAPGPLADANALPRARTAANAVRRRVVVLLQLLLGPAPAGMRLPTPVTTWTRFLQDWPAGAELEAGLLANLRPQGPFAGIGEVALYFPLLQTLRFDSPELQTIFEVVNQARGIVMVHPRESLRLGSPTTTAAEVEAALRRYPGATFLLHGRREIYDLIEPLMDRYPNLYFSFDFPSWAAANVDLPRGIRCCDTKEIFLADIELRGLDFLVDQAVGLLTPRLALHPDRVMWGTDRFLAWHFEADVSAWIMAISRVLIARLPAELQEAFAYRNAQRVLGRYLVAGP